MRLVQKHNEQNNYFQAVRQMWSNIRIKMLQLLNLYTR